eukprot:GHVU01171686.1.p1 GENE.GHVU01171686.1~~GHVU01171686.1.p1  ORF type:complete len:187 (-),score=11.66 GHVU01171686.1:311-871(-)
MGVGAEFWHRLVNFQVPMPGYNEQTLYIVLAILNIFIPGLGMILQGAIGKDTPNLLVGVFQLLVPLVGWIWGIIWGVIWIIALSGGSVASSLLGAIIVMSTLAALVFVAVSAYVRYVMPWWERRKTQFGPEEIMAPQFERSEAPSGGFNVEMSEHDAAFKQLLLQEEGTTIISEDGESQRMEISRA